MWGLVVLWGVGLLLVCLVSVYHWYGWNVVGGCSGLSRSWLCSFECGFMGQDSSENVFSYTYFLLLVFFVVFDLEISLLLNIPFQGILYSSMMVYLFFLFMLLFGYLVELRSGYVRWSY
uniref:NADH-ubiquinone oxidoreductase chain 3 n=1 Tax=Postharmostomum commutatum TaxID=2336775 RepID=A0A5C1D6H9_9TREM|nr:NADH dehydrogenase subunit 3 [Postharmostomum commutatum]QEL51326.1 NADH dehydrogenase subunit 3 [Postharmostomum commutatum]